MEKTDVEAMELMEWMDKLGAMIEQDGDICKKVVREDPEVRDAVETIHEFLSAFANYRNTASVESHDWKKQGF